MASAELREELNCSVCLHVYTDPVTLSCGHNFCRVCMGNVLDTQEGSGVYTCPECRAEFQERPALHRNMKLCNIAERFLSVQPDSEDSGVFCTYCVQTPAPAAKTCLHCEASLCAVHLSVHSRSAEHVLSEPTSSLENRKCPVHREVLKYYCMQHAACLCVSCCVFGEHRGHKVELVAEAFEKKKEQLRSDLERLATKKEEAEKRVQNLQEHSRQTQEKAASATHKATKLFAEIRKQLDALESRILSDISRQKEAITLQVSHHIQQLETEKEMLSRKTSQLEELCKASDPLTVLRGRESDPAAGNAEIKDKELKRDDSNLPAVEDLDDVLISVTLGSALAGMVSGVGAEASDVLLDVYTAANSVIVSGDLKTASWSEINQSHSKTPKRFKTFCQVLSTANFSSGQHYWEVETSELGNWRVGLAYPSIKRNGDHSGLGYNNKSWCLRICKKDYSVVHNSKERVFTSDSPLRRLGVFLDYEAGRLSFYQLCDSVRHLHTFSASFTEPLHVAILVWKNGWVRIRS
ncbi:E3 ubiquitin/ISG15 ligase TRIM25-like [Pelodytes ibericus]